MLFGFAKDVVVKKDAGDQTDGAEHAVESSEKGARNDVIDETVEDSVGHHRRQFEHSPAQSNDDQCAGRETGRVWPQSLMEELAELRAEGNGDHGEDDKRNVQSEKRTSPAPSTTMTVAAITHNRPNQQNHGIGQSGDQETGDEIGCAKLLEKKLHDARNRAVAQRPSDVTPEEPEGQGRQTQRGVGQSSDRKNCCGGFDRFAW